MITVFSTQYFMKIKWCTVIVQTSQFSLKWPTSIDMNNLFKEKRHLIKM